MKLSRKIACGAGSLLLASALFVPNASADTIEETYPETPKLNPSLPLIHTQRGSDHLKANVLNARPVCNASQDYRTVIYKVTDSFAPVGTISTTNNTKNELPLTQELSKSQSLNLKVNGVASKDATPLTLVSKMGLQGSYSLSWNVGQKIGPYQIPAGFTGEATYGFRAVTMTGTQQFCLANGTWSTPTPYTAFTPIKNQVNVKMYDKASGSTGGIGDNTPSNTTEFVAAPEPGPCCQQPGKAPDRQLRYDLEPVLTVSPAKAEGYAGVVALRIKNVGTERYFQEFPNTTFLMKVKTHAGPEGVDRLITTGNFNGAYVRDLGFDFSTSTRTFEVTLSNPIKAGEEQLVANLNFGDGNTSEGRLHNYIEVTQVGRLADDYSTYNDVRASSTDITLTDFRKKHPGLF